MLIFFGFLLATIFATSIDKFTADLITKITGTDVNVKYLLSTTKKEWNQLFKEELLVSNKLYQVLKYCSESPLHDFLDFKINGKVFFESDVVAKPQCYSALSYLFNKVGVIVSKDDIDKLLGLKLTSVQVNVHGYLREITSSQLDNLIQVIESSKELIVNDYYFSDELISVLDRTTVPIAFSSIRANEANPAILEKYAKRVKKLIVSDTLKVDLAMFSNLEELELTHVSFVDFQKLPQLKQLKVTVSSTSQVLNALKFKLPYLTHLTTKAIPFNINRDDKRVELGKSELVLDAVRNKPNLKHLALADYQVDDPQQLIDNLPSLNYLSISLAKSVKLNPSQWFDKCMQLDLFLTGQELFSVNWVKTFLQSKSFQFFIRDNSFINPAINPLISENSRQNYRMKLSEIVSGKGKIFQAITL